MLDIRFETAWRRNDPRQTAEVKAYWEKLGLVPSAAERERRAEHLCALAYQGERLVAVSTAEITMLSGLKAKVAMMRVSVDPELRRRDIAEHIANFMKLVLEVWAAENPQEGVLGMGAVFVADELSIVKHEPLGPRTGLALVGYMPSGDQIRVAWFKLARI